MSIERIGINLAKPDGSAPCTAKIVVHDGRAYFTTTPNKPYDGALSLGQQTRQALDRIDRRLARVGSHKSLLLTVNIVLLEGNEPAEMNAVWNKWVDHDNPPARICTVGRFTKPDIKVEMTVVAALAKA